MTAREVPAWPVLVMIVGFPLWWATGLTVFVAGLLTVVMVSYLLMAGRLRIVPGLAPLVGFMVWVLACVVMIDASDRLLGYLYRTTILVFVVTAFVYTVRAGVHLTRRRIVNALAFLWLFTIACGVAAMAFPETQLTTPMGMLLPSSLTSNSYVNDLFFPSLAEIQTPYGSPETFYRPAAPFPYANSWGVAIVVLSPAAVAAFLQSRRLWVRAVIVLGFVAMLPPAVATGNRGMFGALALSGVYVVVRLALRNRAAPVLTLAVLGLIGATALVASGLLERIAVRQEYGDSTGTRFRLYEETIRRTLESPLLGYGAPRPSAQADISAGTQGFVWTLMFSYGFVGLALFLLFLWGTTVRTWRAPGDIDLVLHSTLVAASAAIMVYGLDIMQLLSIMVVAAVLLRRRHGLEPGEVGDPARAELTRA